MTFASAVRDLTPSASAEVRILNEHPGARRWGLPKEASFLELHERRQFTFERRDKNAEGRPKTDSTVMPARFPEGDPAEGPSTILRF
jgi:hypothetical protein